jgi:hypothetical protein
VQEQVSEKVEAAANTASEVAAGAQEKGKISLLISTKFFILNV